MAAGFFDLLVYTGLTLSAPASTAGIVSEVAYPATAARVHSATASVLHPSEAAIPHKATAAELHHSTGEQRHGD